MPLPLNPSLKLRSHSTLAVASVLSPLFLGMLTLPVQSNTIQAQTNQAQTNQAQANPNEDSDLGRPTGRTGGAGRTGSDTSDRSCFNQLIAVVPGKDGAELHEGEDCNGPDSILNAAALAYTSTDLSPVWVYVPDRYTDSTLTAELTLIDNQREVERWDVPLPASAGVICLSLPYQLEPNNVYRWRFHVNMSLENMSENPRVSGLIAYSPEQNVYWYDDMARLGTMQHTMEQNAVESAELFSAGNMEAWEQLLDENGLGAIASAPIIHACTDSG